MINYECSRCNTQLDRADITIRKVSFQRMGVSGTVLRSRTTDWLCAACRDVDVDWNQDRYDAPGTRNRRK